MKKIIYLAIFALSVIFASCGKEYLERDNLFEKDLDNYYSNASEIREALTGAYSKLAIDEGSNHPLLIPTLLSDECFSGGGTNDVQTIGTDKFEFVTEDQYIYIYRNCYQGIFAANNIINKFDQADYEGDEAEKSYNWGEVHFLRALHYFRLVQFFGEVPLELNPELEYLGKAPIADLYAQIASDLVTAIESLPSTSAAAMPAEDNGKATKWAAEALLARVFLFYTGYYNQTSLPTVDGGAVTQAQVVTWIEDCINNSGHLLVADFRSLWPFSLLTDADGYAYAGDDVTYADASLETVFAVKYNNQGDWGNDGRLSSSNQYVLYTSSRGQDYPPFGLGWGIGSVNKDLRDSFEPGDIRQVASIIDNEDANEGEVSANYSWGNWNCANETGLWNKKYTNVIADHDGDGNYTGVFNNLYGGIQNSNQLWNMQDDILIRFADVLLMAAELGSNSQANLDRVRARVGLASVPYTLDALKAERRHELAFEGLRYYDLLRWGDAEAAIEAANGQTVHTDNIEVPYSVDFKPERAFVKLPETQVRISQGNLTQNPGWE